MKAKGFLVALVAIIFAAILSTASTFAQSGALKGDALKEFQLRNIGPMLTTGRVQDTTVDPKDSSVIYVASAAGGLWKSVNHGYSFKPIFDNGGAFNMCCIVVDPKDSNILWLGTGEPSNPRAAMYGDGLYKSTDAGETWNKAGLDSSEHIAEIIVDPRNSNTVFVASQGPLWSTGGDRGVFKTTDGGKTWKNTLNVSADTGANGLVIDPANPDVMYATTWQRRRGVGQFVGGGPESGVYKSTDGGNKWTKLTKGLPAGDMGRIAIAIDGKVKPSRVYLLLTAASQASRAANKDESGFYRSDDAGVSFRRMEPDAPPASASATAPGGAAPAGKPADSKDKKADKPAKLAATAAPAMEIAPFCGGGKVEAAPAAARGGGGGGGGQGRGGRGGPYAGGDPGYYYEIFVDPIRPDTIWSVNTNLECSGDGGKSWKAVGDVMNLRTPEVHVDFHDVWVDPANKKHMIFSNDGGVYETYDEGKYFRHFDNLPVTQFYRVAVDNAYPFYKVCGGAQDNNSMCGPSRTPHSAGIRTSDWFITGGGDGFQSRVDPVDPNVVYAQWQTGNIERLDLRTGVSKQIRPPQASGGRGIPTPEQAESMNKGALPDVDEAVQGRGNPGGGTPDRANWDVPYIISPHSHTRLYWATNYVYRSDDRGDTWTRISPDISRQLNPADIPIMGKKWDPQTTVSWNNATTALSNAVALDESPLAEGLIYVGTDDGLLQVTEDGGRNWRKVESFPGAPANTYVADVEPSPRDSNVVFVVLNDWQRGNYAPYLYRSDDRGKTFKSIVGDLPTKKDDLWSLAQDNQNGNLLFLGSEFALWTSVDGGAHWLQLKNGLPTAQIRDIAIQKRESDLALGTFGRGFYILDDFSALREVTPESLASEAQLYPTREKAFQYSPFGYEQSAWMNESTPNPAVGAMMTYSIGTAPASGTKYVITITDGTGKKVRTMDLADQTVGLHRANWNLRGDLGSAPAGRQGGGGGGRGGGGGPQVEPGRYSAQLGKMVGDAVTPIGKAQSVQVVALPEIVK